MKVHDSRCASVPVVTTAGERLVTHAGAGMLAEIADMSGLRSELSGLFRAGGYRWRLHDPGVTLVRAAVGIADGFSNVSTVHGFCGSRPVIFEDPASRSTLARTVFAFGDDLMTPRLDRALGRVRTNVWDKAGYAPASLTIDVDATLLDAHSDKEMAAPTFKKGFGFHPWGAWLDETREPLAMIFRAGNAGSNTAVDHCDVIMRSIDQLPADYQAGHQPGDDPTLVNHPLLVRTDRAGATKEFLADLVSRNIEFSVGFSMNTGLRDRIEAVPDDAWIPAINTDATPRRGAQVVELAGFTGLDGWPAGARLICRREEPHDAATLSLFDQIHGLRHTLMLTNTVGRDIADLELRHRQHARVEDRIRCWKTCGADRQPACDAPANEAWLNTSLLALTLISWTQLIGFDPHSELAKAEPATFRQRILHVAAQHATRGRRLWLHLDRDWPWSTDIANAYHRIRQAFAVP